MIRVDVWLPDPVSALSAGAFGAGALIRLESGATEGGPFTEVTTLAIVGSPVTLDYTYWDAAGDQTTWYQWRVSDSANTIQSPYSDPFQGTSPADNIVPTSYCSMSRALSMFERPPTNPQRIARLAQLLGTATAQVIDECDKRDYFQHPASGTATWIVDGDGSATIHVHEGFVSLSLLELSFDGGKTWVSVTSTDYLLRGDSPWSAEPVPSGEPYFHIRFTGFGSYVNVVSTVSAARLTGVRGWPAVPEVLVEATGQRARQLYFTDSTYAGGAPGNQDPYGNATTSDRYWPQALYNFLQAEHSRFMACHVGSTGEAQLAYR